MTELDQIRIKLIIIGHFEGIKATEIAREANLSRHEVNSYLYSHKNEFEIDHHYYWRLKSPTPGKTTSLKSIEKKAEKQPFDDVPLTSINSKKYETDENKPVGLVKRLKADINSSVECSKCFAEFQKEMRKRGYLLERLGKYLRAKHKDEKVFRRFDRLGAGYSEREIRERCEKNSGKTIIHTEKKADYSKEILERIKRKDTFAEFDRIHAKGITLMAHQKAGAEIAEQYRRFAFFYDTGTGKTIMVLNIITERYAVSNARFLIVAPKPLIKSAWLEDAKYFPTARILPLSSNISFEEYKELYNKWAKEEQRLFDWDTMYDNARNRDLIIEKLSLWAHHFIINIEQIRSKEKAESIIDRYKISGLIIDESAILKNHKSKSSTRIRVISKKMDYLYLLSGKPAPNSPVEYYSQMKIVDPDTFFMTYETFVNSYFRPLNRFKLVLKNQYAERSVSNMVGNRSIIVRKEDCIDLPEETRIKISVDLDSKAKEFYADVLNNFMTEIRDMDNNVVSTKNMGRLARIAKLREIASGFYLDEDNRYRINDDKLEMLMQLLDDIGDYQVIIWCNFQFEIETIEKELLHRNKNVVTAYGKTRNLDDSIATFKSGEAQYIIAHPRTLKYGVTFTNCHYTVYNSLSYSYEDYYQSHDRVFRKGQTQKCFYYHLLSKNTIDEILYSCIGDKHMSSRVFEQLVKSSSKFGFSKDKIAQIVNVRPEVKAVATMEQNVT